MLVGAGVRAGGNPGRFLYGAGTGAHAVERSNYNKHGSMRCALIGEASKAEMETAGYPNGYEHPTAWVLPRRGGGMASRGTLIVGAGGISAASLAMGRALSADLTGSGDITAANLSLIVSLLASLSGSSSVTASLRGAVQLAADLAGDGDLAAAMGAIIFMSAALEGAGTLDGSNLTGLASMAADILSYGELTPEGLRDAVWGALLEAGITAEDLLRLAAAGAAGKLSGAAGTTVTVRDVSDQHDIIVATVDGDGNRSAIVLDLDQ